MTQDGWYLLPICSTLWIFLRSRKGNLMSDWLANCFMRVIFILWVLDWFYVCIDRLRSVLVLAFASDAVLDRYNDLAFGADSSYHPGATSNCLQLFSWEA